MKVQRVMLCAGYGRCNAFLAYELFAALSKTCGFESRLDYKQHPMPLHNAHLRVSFLVSWRKWE